MGMMWSWGDCLHNQREIKFKKMTENSIETKSIISLLGNHFYIPNYQRGYRWSNTQVIDLLEDIWEYRTDKGTKRGSFYCLQPIVVKEYQWQGDDDKVYIGYEVIDGQQRLTTIHRILTYLTKEHLKVETLVEEYNKELFTIHYQTRPDSNKFLNSNEYNNETLDFYYMSEAYTTIKTWFNDEKNAFDRSTKNKFMDTLLGAKDNGEFSVQVIWYNVQKSQDSIELFTRLNRGKIPLTSAELIKAKFLNSKSFSNLANDDAVRKKTEIVQIWDEIENELNDKKFWAFISNKKIDSYSSKIELLFDIKTNKKNNELDPLFTYLHFFKDLSDSKTLWDKWVEIEGYYLTLKNWFRNKNYYHKLGFLVCANVKIAKLLEISSTSKKSEFNLLLDKEISSAISSDIDTINYKKNYEDAVNILLLFNVETIRSNNNDTEYFPFELYKNKKNSLEHVHAQNAEGISKTNKQQWEDWLNEHSVLIKELVDRNAEKSAIATVLLMEIEQIKTNLTFEKFISVSTKIIELFSDQNDEKEDYMHNIKNLALIGQVENTRLSNAVFELKRRGIIDMDMQGIFIPICTKRLFLKYYNNTEQSQLSFWSKTDREMYLKKIKETLSHYINIDTKSAEDEN